jgi:endoglucanase Acf2
VSKDGNDYHITFRSNGKNFVVISILPSRNLLGTYDPYARNRPTDSRFTYDYDAARGQFTTTFTFVTEDLQTGGAGKETLFSVMPHHYRNSTQNFNYINGATYTVWFELVVYL